ncbi:MAG: hypothetical protein E7572_09875 [Ruminococcaceae bacterium]|jgi:hypothetical protein|nr:hypothetical protein [Oscillospiraceae bacterium]
MKNEQSKKNSARKIVGGIVGGLIAGIFIIGIAVTVAGTPTASTASSSMAGAKSSVAKEASKKVYSDSTMDVSFEGLSNQAGLDGEMFIGLTVKNKSSKSFTVTLTDVCIDDTMMPTGSGVPLTILPGKSGTGAFFGKNSTKPDNVKKIGFKVYLLDESASNLETTKQIEVKLK